METVVEQALCHVEGGDVLRRVVVATVLLAQSVEDELVLAHRVDGQFVVTAQALLDVVGIQHAQFTGHGDVLLAEAQQIGVGADDDGKVAKEERHVAQ